MMINTGQILSCERKDIIA